MESPSDRETDGGYAPECYACPIGTVFTTLQRTAPDATEHLLTAGRELVAAFRSLLDGASAYLDEVDRRREPSAPIQSIPIRRP